jgi:uncharacterized membrane protein
MAPVIYALVFGVFLGLLSTDASNPWLKWPGYVLSAWMFVAAIAYARKMSKEDSE